MVSTSERKKLKHRESKSLAQAHTASEGQNPIQIQFGLLPKNVETFPWQKMTVKLLNLQL